MIYCADAQSGDRDVYLADLKIYKLLKLKDSEFNQIQFIYSLCNCTVISTRCPQRGPVVTSRPAAACRHGAIPRV